MNSNKTVYFNIYSYRGDPYSETISDIINKNNESNISTSNANVDILYTLPIDKIVCVLDDEINYRSGAYNKFSNTKVVWDFGDGTLSTDLSAVHWYKSPGKYKITLTVFDKDLNAYLSDYNNDVSVYNFVPNELTFDLKDDEPYGGNSYGDLLYVEPVPIDDNLDTNNNLIYFNCPYYGFNLHKFNSWQSYNVLSSIGYNVQIYVEGNNAPFITQAEYNSNAYSHLSCTSKIINDDGIISELIHFDNKNAEVFVKWSGTSFVTSISSDSTAVLAGVYQKEYLRYIDDIPVNNHETNIAFIFDTSGFKLQDNYNSALYQQWVNYIPYTHTFTTTTTNSLTSINYNEILLNSCGIPENNFDIYNYKYIDTPINFVLQLGWKVNETQFYPYKFIPTLYVSVDGKIKFNNEEVGKIKLSNLSNVLFSSITDNITDNISGGYLKGTFTCTSTALNVNLIPTFNEFTIPHVGNISPKLKDSLQKSFNIIEPKEYVTLFKVNEDFNMVEMYKSLAMQPSLKDCDTLFNDIYGQIFGDASNSMNLGVQIYEKISNFISNTQDIDTCNIMSLYGIYNKFDEYIADLNYSWPAELQRVIDLLSIKLDKLIGGKNSFALDFNKKGYLSNPAYGKNLGEEIDFYSSTVTTDEYIVAYEKFSEKYTLLNCNISNKYIKPYIIETNINNVHTFALSGYCADVSIEMLDIVDVYDEYNEIIKGEYVKFDIESNTIKLNHTIEPSNSKPKSFIVVKKDDTYTIQPTINSNNVYVYKIAVDNTYYYVDIRYTSTGIAYFSVSQPQTSNNISTYENIKTSNLSYENWGWNLVLPLQQIEINNITHQKFIGDVNDYYKFYRYISTPDNSLLNSVIDWNNKNKIPYTLISDSNIYNSDAYKINIDEWNKLKQIYILQILNKYINGKDK